MKYNWKPGENQYQRYYDVYVGKVYLLVFENKFQPGIWLGMYNEHMVENKTENDKIRSELGERVYNFQRHTMLSSDNPKYMMEKVEYAFENKLTEVDE